MVPVRVIARIPNVLGDLLAWGRDSDGWWGLVTWSARVLTDGKLGGDVHYSAWMPATTLQRSADPTLTAAYAAVVTLTLPDDRGSWPSPAGRRNVAYEHRGVLTEPPDPAP